VNLLLSLRTRPLTATAALGATDAAEGLFASALFDECAQGKSGHQQDHEYQADIEQQG